MKELLAEIKESFIMIVNFFYSIDPMDTYNTSSELLQDISSAFQNTIVLFQILIEALYFSPQDLQKSRQYYTIIFECEKNLYKFLKSRLFSILIKNC